MKSTKLSDSLGLKCFDFEFVILHNSRQECSRTMVCIPSSDSLPTINRVPIESISPESEVLDMSCAEDSDSASFLCPPKSNSSPAKEESSREWMFSGILTVRNDEEWMQTRKATLTLEDVMEAMGHAFNDTFVS